MIRLFAAVLALLATLAALPARADDNRPFTVTITEEGDGAYDLVWKVPPNVERAFLPDLVAPEACVEGEQVRQWSDALGHWRQQQWTCAQGLAGSDIAIAYPLANPNLATIARVHAGGGVETLLLQPGEHVLRIPAPEEASTGSTFAEFVVLGFEHIREGIDHLLFVTGLIIIAGTWRRILVTVTGFTLAHSLTLALAALDVIRLNTRAVEAVIALSIVFLAVEIARGRRDSLTWRRPVTVAASFGLLHGFGFASVLREIGLPDEGLLTALFAFNVGIEIGQVIFAATLFGAWHLTRRIAPALPQTAPLRTLAAYGLGTTASYWLIERLSSA
ncbi:HupE/UreJ family protein [Alteraurantiacibacter aquimixticola]|uniref:HupE/UreJ family protein n=1 Tax=Alteraurantiacibacter aquimixticola TaxID=2489173 RepID=A0A4T3EY10_9SPHN|nr:HupE/UreJ family protein [Alteraurantiacibacter aquimixticola]TIX49538.1 HupE/UreJ family protein [Alteraurantiacibacter aquimixticola]